MKYALVQRCVALLHCNTVFIDVSCTRKLLMQLYMVALKIIRYKTWRFVVKDATGRGEGDKHRSRSDLLFMRAHNPHAVDMMHVGIRARG